MAMTVADGPAAFRPQGHVAVFQPRPGLGDLIWHLPLIRALAAGGPVTLVTKPSTQADAVLAGDPAIARIVWYDRNPRRGRGAHDGVLGWWRLARAIRATGAETGVLLHHNPALAAAMLLGGVRARYGYGTGWLQRRLLNRDPSLQDLAPFTEAAEQARLFGAALGLGALPEPVVVVQPAARASVLARLEGVARPWTVLGIGCHGAARQWGEAQFAAFAAAQLQRNAGSVLLMADASEAEQAGRVMQLAGPGRVVAAIGWHLPEATALLSEADVFVGNDSGLMNLRAAVGRPAYGLFGASGPLAHSALIRPVVPPGGPRAGMAAITVEAVLAATAG